MTDKRLTKEERRKQKNWCSKHQVVHGENIFYWSCVFPNQSEKIKRGMREWKKNPMSKEDL